MTNYYEPEIGQAVFGCPSGEYETPNFVDAFLEYIFCEIDRVFGNVNQRQWDRYEDPQIPDVEFRPYYWGECTCGYDEAYDEFYQRTIQEFGGFHKKDCLLILPNFKFGEVEIRWYKHPGRGQSCNVNWNERAWRRWLDDCLRAIREYESSKLPDIYGKG